MIETETISTASPLASKMKDEVLGDGFDEILTVDDVYRYLDGHFVDVAFLEEGDDGNPDQMPSGRWGYILEVNRMVRGSLRTQSAPSSYRHSRPPPRTASLCPNAE